MSAYICDDSTIATLAAFAALTIDNLSAADAAAVLIAENVRSTNFLYQENTPPHVVDLSTAQAAPDRATLLSLLSRYEYQACECPDYRETAAAKLLERLRSYAVAYVPGDETEPGEPGAVGSAVYDERMGRHGYIVGKDELPSDIKHYSIGANGLEKNSSNRAVIIWLPSSDNRGLCLNAYAENQVEKWLHSRYNWPPITSAQAALLKADLEDKQAKELKAFHAKREAAEKARAAFEQKIKPLIPENCRGVIVAELMQDESEPMSDYYAGSTVKTLILGFSAHNRDLFPEMRKACKAANLVDYPQVLALADPEQSEEHREKYSMGAGYYITENDGSRHSGWQLRKISTYGKGLLSVDRIPEGILCLPSDNPTKPPRKRKTAKEAPAVEVRRNEELNGIELAFKEKPSTDVLSALKAAGYRWHRKGAYWYAKANSRALEAAQALGLDCGALAGV